MYQATADQNIHRIKADALQSGIYFLQVKNSNQTVIEKIIVD